jgi:hypothetical protein
LRGRASKRAHAAAGAILDVKLEPAGRAQARDRGRIEEQHHGVLDACVHADERSRQVARIEIGRRAFIPVLEGYENRGTAGLLASGKQVEAGNGKYVLDGGVLFQVGSGLIDCRPGAVDMYRSCGAANSNEVPNRTDCGAMKCGPAPRQSWKFL